MKRMWIRRFVMAGLMAGTLAGGAMFGASSVRTWIEQNEQRTGAQQTAVELDQRIAELEAEIGRRTSEEAVRREALCFGPFVPPGAEIYAVPGLQGCVTSH